MDISYKLIKKNTVLYRGTKQENKSSEKYNKFYRGLYLGEKKTAKLYQKKYFGIIPKSNSLEGYKTKHNLYFFILNKSNILKLIKIIKNNLQKGLVFNDGVKISKKEAIDIIELYSNISSNVIKIHTDSFLKIRNHKKYLGLWFSNIICFFGYDGYYVPQKYKRRTRNIKFHEEYYFCFPRIHLNTI